MSKKGSYSLFSDNDTKEAEGIDILDNVCPKMTYKQRLYGFCICAGIGWFISFISFISFFEGNIDTFAIMYTCGNLIAIGSTCFLSGPKDQAKKMIDPKHYIATIIFVCSLIFTLICALVIKIAALTLISALVQLCAYGWYTLGFIPYGHTIFKKTLESCCK